MRIESELIERAAVAKMKQNKAGVDGIPAEFWKVLSGRALKELIGLCSQMYEEGVWPKDFSRVIMIPLQKKTNAVECGTISLISHASKIMLKILTKRIEAQANDVIGRNQFGFRKGCG